MTQKENNEPPVVLSENAIRRICSVNKDGGYFRIAVKGGGCQGFSYIFSFDGKAGEKDEVFDFGPAKLVVDKVSLGFLQGVHIDFTENVIGARFEIKNPNATSSCGCGTSFNT